MDSGHKTKVNTLTEHIRTHPQIQVISGGHCQNTPLFLGYTNQFAYRVPVVVEANW